MIIDEPKHYQKHATTRNPYIVLFGFVTVAGEILGGGVKQITPGSDFLKLDAGSYFITGSEIGTMVNGPSGLPTSSRFRVFVINHASKSYQTIFLFNNSNPNIWVAKKNGISNIAWTKITSETV